MTQPAPELPGLAFERVLGSGGYSDVYLYRQHLPSRQVAVKVLKAAGIAEAQRRAFTAEANAMAGLADHPNIVPVFSAAVSADGRPYLVMMYYAQPNLAVRAASERLGVAEVLRVGIQIASAVETAHRAGILHRDIKPANLLTNQYGTPGLTDFGIAGQMHDLDDDEDTGVSVPWAAPEVLYNSAPTSVRSDVYSLAATMWHLLVGRSPFEERRGDNSTFALMRRIRDQPPPPTGRPDVPDDLERVLRQAMNKEVGARPASAIEFARRLQSVEQGLHLPRTEIVVTTDDADSAPPVPPGPPGSAPQSTGPSTVSRPLAVSPQAPLAPGPPDAPTTGERPERFTAQRPRSLRYSPGDPDVRSVAVPEPERPRHTGRVIAAAVVVAGVAVGAGFVISSVVSDKPAQPKGTISQTAGTQNAGLPGQEVPPGTPKVTGRRSSATQAVFTWTYAAPQPGDSFQWTETGGARRHDVARKPTLTLRTAAGARTCIKVKVVRADGSDASPSYSPAGCA